MHFAEINWIINFHFCCISLIFLSLTIFNCAQRWSVATAVAEISWINSQTEDEKSDDEKLGCNNFYNRSGASRAEECFWKLKLLFHKQWLMLRHKHTARVGRRVFFIIITSASHRAASASTSIRWNNRFSTIFSLFVCLGGNNRKWLRTISW